MGNGMRRKNYAVILAAGLAGIMLIAGGCGKYDAVAVESSAKETAAAGTTAETTAVGTTEETTAAAPAGETAAETGAADSSENGSFISNDTADLSAAPGAVWFDKDTMTAHGDIADTSTTEAETAPAGEETDVTAPVKIWGTIVSVEGDENTADEPDVPAAGAMITVDNQSDVSSPGEMIIHIDPAHSVVVDAVNGLPVELSDLEEGESFVAYLGPAMTMSLPPQVTAYAVIVKIPEDFKAPTFVFSAGAIVDTDNGKLLDAYGEQDYMLADDVEVLPYLTRNIVTLEDIHDGSRCLIWTDEYDMVTKIVLFAD